MAEVFAVGVALITAFGVGMQFGDPWPTPVPPPTLSMEWVRALNAKSCSAVCGPSLSAVQSGQVGSGEPQYVCRAPEKSERPGFNADSRDTKGKCLIEWGRRGVGETIYDCLCLHYL